MSLKESYADTLRLIVCTVAGMLAGGLIGDYVSVNHPAHHSQSDWYDLSALDIPISTGIDAFVGMLIGVAAGCIARAFTGQARNTVTILFLLCAGVSTTIPPLLFQEEKRQHDVLELRTEKELRAAHAREQANYIRLAVLQYPNSRLQPQRPRDAISMTSRDAPQAVADYYQRVLQTSIAGIDCAIEPSHTYWIKDTSYQGVPLHLTITSDDINDGGQTRITISTTGDAPSPVAAALPPAPSTSAPISLQDSAPDPQKAKILRIRAKLDTLGYPGALEMTDAKSDLILTFATPDPVDKAGLYYRDQLGLPLRQFQGKDAMVWVGDITYRDIPIHLAVFRVGERTTIQMD